MKSRTFIIEFFRKEKEDSPMTITQTVTAETDTAAVMMAFYNVRDEADDLRVKSIIEAKGK